jgi:hypothetical protein
MLNFVETPLAGEELWAYFLKNARVNQNTVKLRYNGWKMLFLCGMSGIKNVNRDLFLSA